ncbi:uncharacterized protein [Parasteatoda tepidariorum]|uniref:uncharacterized protein n=1 Tax=Parasteatoda tepidariorum TaxID=114398 RepID=UPI00077FA6F1|nr:uncharacterized protein LOC107456062 isoform X2 [Parasteatoda tepidariorum]
MHRRSQLSVRRDDSELTLMRLKMLFKTVLTPNECSRFEERKLCRNNLVKFLVEHLSSENERVRYSSLDLLCCAIPRLENKTDPLLMPVLPKVMRCMHEAEMKETILKALHFFRSLFRHTKDMSRFIEELISLGTELDSITSQMNFFHGLNIVFDQNIGDDLYSHLIQPLGKALLQNCSLPSCFAIYRALKKIHEQIGDEDFYNLLSSDGLEAQCVYTNCYKFENEDPYLNSSESNLSVLIREYLRKSSKMKLDKAFGIVDFALLKKIAITKDSERAVMVDHFAIAFKKLFCDELDYAGHLMDILKLVCAFLLSSNRPVQMSGFKILRDVITKMGFYVSPHLSYLIGVLRECLTSPNSEIKCKTDKILNKLMRAIHPMTIIWELLKTNDALQKEAILRFILKELNFFPYCCFDLIALSKCLTFHMQDPNSAVHRASVDCMIVLLSIMRATPVYGIRAEASKLMLPNYHLQRGTEQEEDDEEDVDSISNDGTTDADSSAAQTSMTTASLVSLSTTRSDATLREDSEMEKDNIDTTPTPSMISPTRDYDVLPERETSGVFPKKKNDASYSVRMPSSEIKKSNCRLPESKVSLNRPKMSYQEYLGANTIESTSTLASYVSDKKEQKSAKSRSYCIINSKKTPHSGGDAFQASNMQTSRHVWREKRDREHARRRHMGEGDMNDYSIKAADESDAEYTPFIEDVDQFKEDQSNPKSTQPTCKIENLDPQQFNIESVSASKTMISVREVSEDNEFSQSAASIVSTSAIQESLDEKSSQITQTGKDYKTYLNKNSKHSFTELIELKRRSIRNSEHADDAKNDPNVDIDAVSATENGDTEESEIESVVDLIEEKSDISDTETAQTPCPNEAESSPFKKGRELLRTPPTVQRQLSTKTRIKVDFSENDSKSVLCSKKDYVSPKTKENPRVKKREVKKSKSSIEKSTQKQDIVAARKVQSFQDEATPVKTKQRKQGAKVDGCPWPRDIEYASKGEMPLWAEKFEKTVDALKPYSTIDEADASMKKAVEDLFGTSWKLKEEAMLNVIRLTKHHPEIVCDNSTKILSAICNEVKNIRQSIAGKAIFTCGYMYQVLGRRLENKLRMVLNSLLMKSSNRTLASYFRLVIESLFKVVESSSPQKAAQAFVVEGGRHPNKASREIAAQFLAILTDKIGTLDPISQNLASQMVKCASFFVTDSSAITRYCAKRMIQVLRTNPSFEKIKDQQLDVNQAKDLTKVLELIDTKGVNEEILPINIIRGL